MGLHKVNWKSAGAYLLKLVVGVPAFVTVFVLFNDWHSRQTRLDVLPIDVSLDETLVLREWFTIRPI